MSFIIRKGEIKDMASVLELIQELAVFEKEPNAVEIDMYDLIKDGFSSRPAFHIFVAEMGDDIVGMALFYPRFSTWKGKSMHLEDLIVSESKRGLGIGKALYNTYLSFSHDQNAKRVEWVVLDWNKHAIEFYEKSGATVYDNWRVVQMDKEKLSEYVAKINA